MITNPTSGKVYLTKEEKAAFSTFWILEDKYKTLISNEMQDNLTGNLLKDIIRDGFIICNNIKYAISWMSYPETCFKSNNCILKFRLPIKGSVMFPTVLILSMNEE